MAAPTGNSTNQSLAPYTEPAPPAVRSAGVPVPWQTWEGMMQFAEIAYDSGLAPKHVTSWQAALLIMQTGLELRIPPAQALAGIYYFNGKVTLSAKLMVAIIKRDHGGDAIRVMESTDKRCTVSYKRRDAQTGGEYSWSIEQAQTAGLKSDTWNKYPAAMLRARALSAVASFEFPDLIGGMVTPEELGAQVQVTSTGDVVIDGDAYAARPDVHAFQAQRPVTPMHHTLAELLARTWHDITGDMEPIAPDGAVEYYEGAIGHLMELLAHEVQPEGDPSISAEQEGRLKRAHAAFRRDYGVHLAWPEGMRSGGANTVLGILTRARDAASPKPEPVEAAV